MEHGDRRKPAHLGAVAATVTCLLLIGAALKSVRTLHQVSRHRLPHEFRSVSQSVTCGAVPESSEEFHALNEAGIRTIVSVDGMRPDIKAAAEAGLRYVHIPIGYDGVPREDIARMTRVLQDCPHPIYVHCHHGKHRGPAAAAVCAMITTELNVQQAIDLLTNAGTSHDYAGLWRDVSNFEPLPADVILPPLASSVELEPLATLMVEIDECWERLQNALKSSSLELAVEQSNVLLQLFRETSRLNGANESCPWLNEMLAAESAAKVLSDNLQNGSQDVADSVTAVSACCRGCHEAHRN